MLVSVCRQHIALSLQHEHIAEQKTEKYTEDYPTVNLYTLLYHYQFLHALARHKWCNHRSLTPLPV